MSNGKTLGELAYDAYWEGLPEKGWVHVWKDSADRTDWERAAAAVIAEYERRRVSHVIASSRVVSESGAAVTVTEYELTDNARQGLGLPFDCICECSQQPGLGK